ncbi:UPF0149 family protein [Aliiglaciecola sp. LCG003]|uniref:UPF0149 family protein n=1 Tax=Aliiglaciecola sp. LCG003 TaxID=3053655 RepID=UPI0025737C8B|nr:UPF0149 family protein [Aliiglaciecola sp. LCG003]WJG10144.1 UPF0149 family protein [Aliiglaciecola sp. LCG003]
MPFASPNYQQQLKGLYTQDYKQILHSELHIHGLIFAVCAAPEIPLPEDWLAWAFRKHGQIANEDDMEKIAQILMGLLQEQLQQMRMDQIEFPMKGQLLPVDADENIEVSQWLTGLLAGHAQLESIWQGCWEHVSNEMPEKLFIFKRDLKHCLMMFSTFGNVPLAIKQAKKVNNHKLLNHLPAIFASLPDALKTYINLSGELAKYLPDQFEIFQQNKGGE